MEPKEESSSMRNIQEQESLNVGHSSGIGKLKEKRQGDGDKEESETTSKEKETFSQNVQRPADIPNNRINEPNDQQSTSIDYLEKANVCIPIYENNATEKFVLIDSCSSNAENYNDFIGSRCEKLSSENERISKEKQHVCGASGPSTSGLPKASTSKHESINSDIKKNKKRALTLKVKGPLSECDDTSSDSENDDYSLGSEDGCIYSYREDEVLVNHLSPFLTLDVDLSIIPHNSTLSAAVRVPRANRFNSRLSSPDMDFLEMDFDPCPSCEADTGGESTPEYDVRVPVPNNHIIRGTSPAYERRVVQPDMPPVVHSSTVKPSIFEVPLTRPDNVNEHNQCTIIKKLKVTRMEYITHVNVRGEQLRVRRTMSEGINSEPVTAHSSSGDLDSPSEILNYKEKKNNVSLAHKINQGENTTLESVNLTIACHVNMAKGSLTNDKCKYDEATSSSREVEPVAATSQVSEPYVEAPRCMVWSEREACERQVIQVGSYASGETAIINVFLALGIPVNVDRINEGVGTRQTAINAPIPRYLFSRSVAGCTAADLVAGIHKATDGLVTARFFPTHPERNVSLLHWLGDWISLGAVPILTLNVQLGAEEDDQDAWHHQMVYGVSPRGVYLCNPFECVPEAVVWSRLVAPSVLLVRSREIVTRFDPDTDMSPLTAVGDIRFHRMNVLGQVANVLREWRYAGSTEAETRTRFVAIPASQQAGVTVAALTGSEAHRRLVHAPELPVHSRSPPTPP